MIIWFSSLLICLFCNLGTEGFEKPGSLWELSEVSGFIQPRSRLKDRTCTAGSTIPRVSFECHSVHCFIVCIYYSIKWIFDYIMNHHSICHFDLGCLKVLNWMVFSILENFLICSSGSKIFLATRSLVWWTQFPSQRRAKREWETWLWK